MCFTSDNQMKRADSLLFADLFPSFLKHTSSSSFVECWPNQTGLKPGLLGRLNHLLAVWLDSKCLSACVSHSAAALCVCVSDSRTATYCVVLVFAFEKAATVSLVVVQQWVWVCVCVRVCMCACGCGVLANPASTWPNYFLLKFILFFFSLVALCSPNPGFYHKAGQSNLHRQWWLSLLSEWADTKSSGVTRDKQEVFSTKICKVPMPCILICNFFDHTVAPRYFHVYK